MVLNEMIKKKLIYSNRLKNCLFSSYHIEKKSCSCKLENLTYIFLLLGAPVGCTSNWMAALCTFTISLVDSKEVHAELLSEPYSKVCLDEQLRVALKPQLRHWPASQLI